MGRGIRGVATAALALTFVASTLAPAWAVDLPANLDLSLSLSAAQSDTSLLDAVREAIEVRPDLAPEIVEAAIGLKPDLAEDIRLAAASTGADIEVRPAVGPIGLAFGPILAGTGAVGAAAAVVGAGGGGGDSDDSGGAPPPNQNPAPPAPPAPPNSFETSEYFRSNGLDAINASDAYGRGLTGAGVIVGVVDTGIDASHSEFIGRIAPGGYSFLRNSPNTNDTSGHGSHVSGIIAANRDGVGMHGVAYGASILPLQIGDHNGIPLGSTQFAAVTDYAVSQGAYVLNNSWGISGVQVTDFTPQQLNGISPEVNAYRRAGAAGRVIVFAAHNSSLANPAPRAGLPYLVPDLQPFWLAVVATNQAGSIASYSNRCGVAAAWCLAAPGSNIVSVNAGANYTSLSGTSMAAPHVTAAVAVLKQLFPSLSSDQIVQRILTTANGSGIYNNEAIYGQGLLDLERATRPVGATEVLTGATIADASFQLGATSMQLSPAFGDGLKSALSGAKLAVFDSQRATFFVDLEPFVQIANPSIDLPELMQRFGAVDTKQYKFGTGTVTLALTTDKSATDKVGESKVEEFAFTTKLPDASSVSMSYNQDPALGFGLHGSGAVDQTKMITQSAFAAPFLSLTDKTVAFGTTTNIKGLGDLRVTSFTGNMEDDEDNGAFGTAMELGMQPAKSATIAIQLGIVSEEATFLGTGTKGAFAFSPDTPTLFSGISGELELTNKLSLVGSIYSGISTPKPSSQSLFSDVSPIMSQSFSIGLVGQDLLRKDDGFGVILNQPLRVTSGSADIALTNGRDAAGNLSTTNFNADLTPTGRELDFEVFYSMALGEESSLTASAAMRVDPGHVADASDEGILALRFRHKF